MPYTLPYQLLGSCLLASCLIAQTSRPSSRPTSRPSKTATGGAEARALAAKVQAFAGGRQGLAKVDNLLFTFAGRRVLFWDRRAQRVRIENLGESGRGGRTRGRFIEVMVRDLRGRKDLLQVPESKPPQPRVSGYGAFINDSYWLLIAHKVLDPGVQLSIDPPQPGDAAGLRRLRLRFAKGVGITPQNSYVLHVAAEDGRILAWDYYRRPGARPRSWTFVGYRRLGGLRLSLMRKQIGGKLDIALEDLRLNCDMPADIWSRSDRYLVALVGRLQKLSAKPKKGR